MYGQGPPPPYGGRPSDQGYSNPQQPAPGAPPAARPPAPAGGPLGPPPPFGAPPPPPFHATGPPQSTAAPGGQYGAPPAPHGYGMQGAAGFQPPPGPMPFMAQQQYNPAAYQGHPQQQAPFQPQGPAGGPEASFGIPMTGVNPLNLMAAGTSLFAGGQSYVQKMQQRVGSFTGSSLNANFAVDRQYVTTKLLMLLAPYLRRWTYTRVADTPHSDVSSGAVKFKPPRADVNAPDLYIPLSALWTYVLLVCVVQAGHHTFKPDNVYATAWSGFTAWLVHLLVAKFLLKAMNLPSSVTWVELFAYTGYAYVPVCLAIAAGQALGRMAYYGMWLYGSLASAIFLVRTMKRIIFQEARDYSRAGDLTVTNYLLLGLAAFQFPFAFWLGVRP